MFIYRIFSVFWCTYVPILNILIIEEIVNYNLRNIRPTKINSHFQNISKS